VALLALAQDAQCAVGRVVVVEVQVGALLAAQRGPSGRDLIDQQTLAKTLNFKPIPGESEEAAAGRSLSFREMTTLMQHLAGQGVNGLRDAALIAVAYAGGLRRQEIAHLDLADYDPANNTLRVLR
jgi:integrase